MSTAQPRLKRERKRSREIFERAEKVLVGGVNSPVRAFRSVGGEPLIIERGSGQHLYDADGNELLDYVCSWGAMILGHANPAIGDAIAEQARRGTSFGVTTELELELATLITRAIPFIEKIRFVSSGTEATMSAVRLARGVTKRDFIVKFEGCYHGHADSFLSQAGSGLATLGIAECPGVPAALAALTLNVPYNDLSAVERVFSMHEDKVAAVIVEPIAANMGVVPPETGFLKGLQEICKKNGALLIVDEVIWWRRSSRILWRARRIDGPSCAARPGVSGRHARGEPAGDERWHCRAQTAHKARAIRRDDATGAAVGTWPSRGTGRRRNSCPDQCIRFARYGVLHIGAGEKLQRCQALQQQAIRQIFPRDA